MVASYASTTSQNHAQPMGATTPTSDSSARVQKRAELRGHTFEEQEALLAPPEGADAQVQATGAKGTETPVGAAPAPTPEETEETSTRPADMTFKLDRALLERGMNWRDGDSADAEDAEPDAKSVIGRIANAVHTYERTQCKDGARLTPEEILCLAVQTMWKMSIDITQQRVILYQLFFSHHSPKVGDDYILDIQPSGGNVTLGFSTTTGDGTVRKTPIESMHFSGPVAYEGTDTNQRESRVQASKSAYKDDRGNYVSAGAGSVMTRTTPQFLIAFTLSQHGREWRDVPYDQLESAPGFKKALLDYRHQVFMYDWMNKAVFQAEDAIASALGSPPSPVTEAWVTDAVRVAIDALLTWNSPNILAVPHAVITPEDEGAIQKAIARLCPGVTVNLDVDANGGRDNIKVKGVPKPAGPIDPTVSAHATSKAVSGELRMMTNTQKGSYGRLYQSLPPEGRALLESWDLTPHHWVVGRWTISEAPGLELLAELLHAWQALAEAQAKGADTAAAQERLDAAVAGFKATPSPTTHDEASP